VAHRPRQKAGSNLHRRNRRRVDEAIAAVQRDELGLPAGAEVPPEHLLPRGGCLQGAEKAMNLTTKQLDTLETLAGYPHGVTEELFVLVHRFDRDMLADLVDAGLVSAQRYIGKAGGSAIEVTRFRITDAGQRPSKG
jgi:hypothetical protein